MAAVASSALLPVSRKVNSMFRGSAIYSMEDLYWEPSLSVKLLYRTRILKWGSSLSVLTVALSYLVMTLPSASIWVPLLSSTVEAGAVVSAVPAEVPEPQAVRASSSASARIRETIFFMFLSFLFHFFQLTLFATEYIYQVTSLPALRS